MRIGSLFSGAGGLDMAVEQVFGATTAWHCELDPAASKVLAHRWPGVPNLGDITEVDWAAVESVDILCGGYPCQPFSAAGQRKGTNDERHLWPYFAEAIRALRPRFVVLENVAGHRSMGFDRVLADLAGIGYDAQWCSVRASDVGAPHRRERLFVLATDADTGRLGSRVSSSRPAQGTESEALAGAARVGTSRDAGRDAANTPRDGWHERSPESARLVGGSDAAVGGAGPVELLPTPCAQQSGNTPENHLSKKPGRVRVTDLAILVDENGLLATGGELLPTPNAQDGNGGGRFNSEGHQSTLPGTVRELLPTPRSSDCFGPGLHGDGGMDLRTTVVENAPQWGKYESAIRRWETLTRPAPSPTEPNTKGNPRLAAAFSEWMLGWPAGWVTDVPGISRNDALRIVGNGVVDRCAEVAIRWLLTVAEQAA